MTKRRFAVGAQLAGLVALLAMSACGEDDRPATWTYIHAAIIEPSCTTSSCHNQRTAQAGLRLHDREGAYTILVGQACEGGEVPGEAPRNFVDPGSPERSRLMHLLLGMNVRLAMPPDRPLPDPDIELIEQWILEGARCN